MGRRINPLTVWALVLLLALGIVVGINLTRASQAKSNPMEGRPRFLGQIEKAPPLVERSGRGVELGELAGKAWLACYVYTSCPGQCMGVLEELKAVAAEFPADQPLRFVAFSLQPETDTPEKLLEWAKVHEVDNPRWLFLTTGDPPALTGLMTGPKSQFKLNPVIEYDPATQADLIAREGPFGHDARVVLVDGKGRIRGYYNLLDPAIGDFMRDKLLRDLGMVLEETSGGEGGGGRSLWWLVVLLAVVVVFVALTGGRRGQPDAGPPHV
jgi:protein SCO1